jgi:hypothetical protein
MGGEKASFREDVLAPAAGIKIEFQGKNPTWILGAATRLLRDTMKVSSVNLREDEIRWDVTGDPKSFYGIWRCYRGEDRWCKSWIKITAQGTSNREGFGEVGIKLEGWIETDYEYGNPISVWLWNLWNYIFYWKQRRAYIDFVKDEIMEIREKILRAYGIARE